VVSLSLPSIPSLQVEGIYGGVARPEVLLSCKDTWVTLGQETWVTLFGMVDFLKEVCHALERVPHVRITAGWHAQRYSEGRVEAPIALSRSQLS
jgi:hypothetical protein